MISETESFRIFYYTVCTNNLYIIYICQMIVLAYFRNTNASEFTLADNNISYYGSFSLTKPPQIIYYDISHLRFRHYDT